MVSNSGYLRNTRISFKDRSRPLVVSSCGTYRLVKRPTLPTWRPKGRLDFQLIYVASGKAHFFLDDQDVVVSAGCMVLYRPKQEQHYVYYGKDRTEVFWVHFTGSDVTNILRHYGFPEDQYVLQTGRIPEYRRIFQEMVEELQNRPAFFEENLSTQLRHLLILISRQMAEKPGKRNMNVFTQAAMEEAVHYFTAHYTESIGIGEYATSIGMSSCWFIRCFKEFAGVTPRQFILGLRILNARDLLIHSAEPIAGVAAIVGFDNALYFSRVFHKQVGMSPSEYRESGGTGKV